jgi:hypothetical protein
MITNLRCRKCNPKVCPSKAVECARHLHEAAIDQGCVLSTERFREEEIILTTNLFVSRRRER